MDLAACHVLYVDTRAAGDSYIWKGSPEGTEENGEVQANIRVLLSVFNGVYISSAGPSCLAKLRELNISTYTDLKPVIVILGIPFESIYGSQTPIPAPKAHTPSPLLQSQDFPSSLESDASRAFTLLRQISAELSCSHLSKLILPVSMIHSWKADPARTRIASGRVKSASEGNSHRRSATLPSTPSDSLDSSALVTSNLVLRCLEAGAIDCLPSPLQQDRLYGLTAHAFRAHKDASKDQPTLLTKQMRKRSWVGMNEEKPYAYLRESMVSGLMQGICNPESAPNVVQTRELYILDPNRELAVMKMVGHWNFSAHDLSDDELIHAGFLMLQHALNMPELEEWRLPADDLKQFLLASRAAYNAFVLYHNFRHVIDVLQAIFWFLTHIGTLPPYPFLPDSYKDIHPRSPIAALLKPLDALTLLISAIGHDVGHPGVNNAFLVALNAPLAQLYNDKSVLEAFHCAAYSQILRRYWRPAFSSMPMRALMINSILATDMGLHFKYMADLGSLQEKIHHNDGTDGWSPQKLDEYRTLTCGLLIKCADISNVARPFDIAAKWADILQLEFANQGEMEKEVGIPSALFGGPPDLGNIVKLARSQVGFMNIFAQPLFEAMTDLLPGIKFAVETMKSNKKIWERRIQKEKAANPSSDSPPRSLSGGLSPRSLSPVRSPQSPDASNPEGLPASGSPVPLALIQASMDTQLIPPSSESHHSSAGSAATTLKRMSPASGNPSQDLSKPSFNSPFGLLSTGPELNDPFRQSSGASPDASISPRNLALRRSSNTLPSQLNLNSGPISPAVGGPDENTRPTTQTSMASASQPESAATAGFSFHKGSGSTAATGWSSSHTGSVSSGGGGGGENMNRHDGSPMRHPQQQSNRYSTLPFPPRGGRFSARSGARRESEASSNAGATLNHYTLRTPGETQSASFVSMSSDDMSSSNGNEHSMPSVIDLERPGKGSNVKTSVISGNSSFLGRGSPGDGTAEEPTVRKKTSKFRFDFWKKKGRIVEASP